MHPNTTSGIHFSASVLPLRKELPTIFFIHGSGATGILWQHQVDALADIANTIALDLPGHGDSQGPSRESIPAYAEELAAFIKPLNAPRPIVCGLSLGGGIALQMLLDYGDILSGGILISTGARLRVMPTIFKSIRDDFDGFVRGMPLFAASPHSSPALFEPLLEATLSNGPEVTAGDFRACDTFDVTARLGEIRLPVMIITAEEDHLTPPKYGQFIEKRIAGAERRHLSRAGHLVPLEQPEGVNEAIRQYIEKQNGPIRQ